ncbi:MAG: nitroreductase family protein [Candidatus Thorarchaeota archaeon]|nr:nitroreductase family protein [Candidatus Thorarchaeota archaeon]
MSVDCIEKLTSRQSIRRFTSESIPDSIIDDIVRIGISAPSGGNRQPWRIIIVTNKNLRNQLADAAFNQEFLAVAPVVFVVCVVPEESAERYKERGRNLYALQDTAALTLNILYGAHLHGYGACWIGSFNEDTVSKTLNIPSDMRPVAMIPVGKIDGKLPPARPRKKPSEIVVKEQFE